MAATQKEKRQRPPQEQHQQPGIESEMKPQPDIPSTKKEKQGKLEGKVALISGGDSGIGKAVAMAFAREGADVAFVYLNEESDADETQSLLEEAGANTLKLRGDIGEEEFCQQAIDRVMERFGQLDVLMNNAAEQHLQEKLEDISSEQFEKTMRTNFFSVFYLTKAALPHLKKGSAIVNTTSVTAYRGSGHLIDYASSKGAIVAFTRSLALSLAERGIRVNAVAPGPIWTPLIPASFPAEAVAKFGSDVPLGRAGQPAEIAPSYVFLASDDASYMTGQVLHPNGGEIINA